MTPSLEPFGLDPSSGTFHPLPFRRHRRFNSVCQRVVPEVSRGSRASPRNGKLPPVFLLLGGPPTHCSRRWVKEVPTPYVLAPHLASVTNLQEEQLGSTLFVEAEYSSFEKVRTKLKRSREMKPFLLFGVGSLGSLDTGGLLLETFRQMSPNKPPVEETVPRHRGTSQRSRASGTQWLSLLITHSTNGEVRLPTYKQCKLHKTLFLTKTFLLETHSCHLYFPL